ncbi:MAG: hypothetical protein QOF28_2107 [Actinomycetota bacterium]|jgi:hypothetical protein|nr:hypothetical protein [Actinomycetota bacterium]
MIGDMGEIEVVVAHSGRVTLRVGDVFLKIDTDQARIGEVEVMARAPIPTPEVWRKPPVLALAAVPGAALGLLKEPSRLRLTDPRRPQGPTRIEERVGGAVENSDELVVGHAIGCPA